jgi:hypothetical protein
MLKLRGFRREGSWPERGTVLAFDWGKGERALETVRTAGVQAEI